MQATQRSVPVKEGAPLKISSKDRFLAPVLEKDPNKGPRMAQDWLFIVSSPRNQVRGQRQSHYSLHTGTRRKAFRYTPDGRRSSLRLRGSEGGLPIRNLPRGRQGSCRQSNQTGGSSLVCIHRLAGLGRRKEGQDLPFLPSS